MDDRKDELWDLELESSMGNIQGFLDAQGMYSLAGRGEAVAAMPNVPAIITSAFSK